MSERPVRILRGASIGMLILLGVQFELGITVNLSNPPELAPFAFSFPSVSDALHLAGTVALIHAILGTWLGVFSLITFILALRIRDTAARIAGALAFLTGGSAASTGYLFTLSGFQNDGFSHGMATNFLLMFSCFFLTLYLLKRTFQPGPNPVRS